MGGFGYMIHSGKNNKLFYYAGNLWKGLLPNAYYRWKAHQLLKNWELRSDHDEIADRVNYYCKLPSGMMLPPEADRIDNFHRKGNRSVYYFDSYEYVRCFSPSLRWCYVFGDVREVPSFPAVLKSRPIKGDHTNSVLLNMDKVRHFVFLKDRMAFAEKQDKILFRGDIYDKPWRIRFMECWFGDPVCDLGEVGNRIVNPDWKASQMTLYAHLDYKFIMALEGNDVASNLKWVMSSNSLAVMPRPEFETWFMEGRLIPDYHYVEIKPDYSDLKERMQYYVDHPEEALLIIRHAHEWVRQFQDKKKERIISLLVLDKYFRSTGQKTCV